MERDKDLIPETILALNKQKRTVFFSDIKSTREQTAHITLLSGLTGKACQSHEQHYLLWPGHTASSTSWSPSP